MTEDQQLLPSDPEPDDSYRPPVETMNFGQVERELRDIFGVAVMYLLVPIFLLAVGMTSAVSSRLLVRVLPGIAAVFVCYWVLLRAFVPMYDAAPEMAIRYSLFISRFTDGIMSTSHKRLAALSVRWEELRRW
ncbi:hypothetical protein [Blastopirellula marina]|uniref:Uncharacterized protein n=1 Tax=Blastopirellula marina TaxID=124 RepID=A0A2S8F9A1_9BACT|nr:hypothetical protein [Blastopirellula marina]PQO28739.1 hypothetical protein C5Y98_23445 [Blastopirellula marina]PTL42012.1 hypothetical protein C5Y97_23460 [Blastopirellula marina]